LTHAVARGSRIAVATASLSCCPATHTAAALYRVNQKLRFTQQIYWARTALWAGWQNCESGLLVSSCLSMYVCVCVCVYVCMYVCMFCMYVCVYVYIYIYMCMCVCMCVCVCVCMYVCMYVCICVYVCMYICMCVYYYFLFNFIYLFIACSTTTVILHALLLNYYTTFLLVLYNCICN